MLIEEHNKAGFVIYLISEFAKKYGIHPTQAYQYVYSNLKVYHP